MDQNKSGKFIAKLRKEKNMTQEQLAEKMGVSINAVSKWERGLSFPDVSLYKKLCKELGISIEELINGELDKSEVAKEKAIINVVKSKNKEKKKYKIVITISTILIGILIVLGIVLYKNKDDELERYYERNYQMSLVARNVEAFLKYRYNGKYPDYYGGMYISDDAYNLVVQLVEENIPTKETMEYNYYNELFTVDKAIKIEYVKNSYNKLEEVNQKLIDYFINNNPFDDLNGFGIDIYSNSVTIHFVKVDEKIIKEFKSKVLDSDVLKFESDIDKANDNYKCVDYPKELGDTILENPGNVLISIQYAKRSYVPVSLSVYDNGTYELFTSYDDCKPGRVCTSMLRYTKSIKGNYNYDIEKILSASTNADGMSFDMNKLPVYEIYLGEEYMEKYDSLMFVVENGKKNQYLDEFLNSINVDLNKCAKPDYGD